MAADHDLEAEVFEITDFTTASEWERFMAKVEEVLSDWKLTGNAAPVKPLEKGEYTHGSWGEKAQEINFADFKFHITHYFLKQIYEDCDGKDKLEEDALPSAMQDLLCLNNDFPPRAHCLVRWYGLREFLVISPGTNCEAIISESKCNLLLSSISISLGNSGCKVPMFVQIQQKWRRMYVGECQGPGVRTDFEIVQVRKVPSQYNHLSGLLDIFKSKIGCTLFPLPPITIAIRFTYVLQDWQQYSWPQQPPDFDTVFGGEVGGVEFGKLPFGACEEPISELHLATTWHHLTEGIVVDNDVYSDLDPLQAPHWSVRVRTAENPQCLLGDFLTEFLKLCSRKESTEDVLGRLAEEDSKENEDISSALSKLTEPAATVPISKLSVSNMMHTARKHIRRHRRFEESPLNADVLSSVLLYLFPDAAVEKSSDNMKNETLPSPEQEKSSEYNLFVQLKSAPSDSLTYRLALCVCLVNYNYGGLRAVAHLWQEFVLELRYRWENNYLVYGLGGGAPDLHCCLLHQKLQMLNCCIERKRARDDGRKDGSEEKEKSSHGFHRGPDSGPGSASSSAREVSHGKSWDSWSDSEEEFFECLSDQGESDFSHTEGEKDGNKRKAEGRLHAFNNMTLLNSTEPLYVPVTQEPAPMTEDVLEEKSEVLARLGTSAEGTHLRARMQSACLLSDMESFKAANPGCVLEDFVRWYSPRDFVEDEVVDEKGNVTVRGELSARMRIPGNMWVEAWETARVSPARRQRRLFDDTTEAEKVLHYLAMLKPSDLARHLLPCVFHATILKLKEEESAEDISSVKKMIQQTTSQTSKLLQSPNYDYSKLERPFTDPAIDSINQFMAVETVITRARSLKAKFAIAEDKATVDADEMEKFVSSLLKEPEVVVNGAGKGAAGSIIHRLFINAQRLAEVTRDEGIFGDVEAALLSPADEDLDGEKSPAGGRNRVPDFPPPAGREILLRTCVPRPAPYSKALPQRLFCVLMKDEFRLAGAFSSDISFF